MVFSSNKQDPFEEPDKEYAQLHGRDDLVTATFAGGCFWCMEGPFEAIDGVEETMAGYVGPLTEPYPTYRDVAGGITEFREGVQVFYDPEKVTYRKLLETYFWQVDPTDKGGQFADRGRQYTTAVYYRSEMEKRVIEGYIQELSESGRYEMPIVTEVLPVPSFYVAEEYHQNFYQKSSEYYGRYAKGSGRKDYIEAMEKKYR